MLPPAPIIARQTRSLERLLGLWAVVMSLDTYKSLMENVHPLRSPANAAHLERSLEQAHRGELLEQALIDPDA